MTDGPARLCLVGCGKIGATHALASRRAPDHVAHAAIFDASPGAAAAFAERLAGGYRIVERWEDVLADPEIDAVDLCVPNSRHAAMALEALDAGKHVFIEKPMALSVADCDRMIEAARARGLQLSVMHNRRFNPAARAVKSMLDAGDLGDPVLVTGHGIEGPSIVGEGGWLRLAREGGVAMAQTVHFAYMVRWLFGDVTRVSCLTSRKGIPWMEGEVTAAFLLQFASGAIGQISSTFAQEAGRHEHRITLYGGSGKATFVAGRADVVSPRRFGDVEWHVEQFELDRGADFAEPLATFGDAIQGRGLPAVPAAEGRAAVALIEAAYRSAREGRMVPIAPTAAGR